MTDGIAKLLVAIYPKYVDPRLQNWQDISIMENSYWGIYDIRAKRYANKMIRYSQSSRYLHSRK